MACVALENFGQVQGACVFVDSGERGIVLLICTVIPLSDEIVH